MPATTTTAPNPPGTQAAQAYRESWSATSSTNAGTLVDHGDGSYTYTMGQNISAVTAPVGGPAVTYDRSLLHRVAVRMGGSSGPTGDATFDFVPDGSTATESRDIVRTETCQECHGVDFHGHGGDRRKVEDCVTCHAPDTVDAETGNTLAMPVMIHKIHGGAELPSSQGPDGYVWDLPATTTVDESDDNTPYTIYGFSNVYSWEDVGFPALAENCTKCHDGSGVDSDNWKTEPSRQACGSCHDDVDFALGTNHDGGAQPNDSGCGNCHAPEASTVFSLSVTDAHDWINGPFRDPRNIPEFDIDISMSPPNNGDYYVAGETPVVTVSLNDAVTGLPIDHTTMTADSTKEGCVPTVATISTQSTCTTPRDGSFSTALLFVHGPRDHRNPVLTTRARIEMTSGTTGPWDISASGATLGLVFDGGKDVRTSLVTYPGTLSVPVSSGTWANGADEATATEIAAWLNANTNFAFRATAYVNSAGKVVIRNRNKGDFFSLAFTTTTTVATVVFPAETTVKSVGSSSPSNTISIQSNSANNDPKAAWTSGSVTYTLDDVADLDPGTYVADVEIGDAGRVDASNYRTPSVARVTFEVGQPDEEPLPARNCNSCHQNDDGVGYVLDYSRHNKAFNDTALDLCGNCHDYQSQNPTGAWAGARAIAKRVHAIHFGSSLNYPLSTVDYSNGDPTTGRNWDITFPQDVRFCEACHTSETSGSWMDQPSRLPCMGCHDSDAAYGHMMIMTWDPSPTNPWSGDEQESCEVCHAP